MSWISKNTQTNCQRDVFYLAETKVLLHFQNVEFSTLISFKSFFVWEETRKIKNSFGNLQANLNLGVTTSKLGIMIGKRRR